MIRLCLILVLSLYSATLMRSAEGSGGSITNLYDAFGKAMPGAQFAWGYSALIRFQGKTILFDAGGNADQFARNVKALGIDLRNVDYAVLSHRHGDHASGFDYVFSVNPSLKLYLPDDVMLGGGPGLSLPAVPGNVLDALPPELRYYPGERKRLPGHGVLAFGTLPRSWSPRTSRSVPVST